MPKRPKQLPIAALRIFRNDCHQQGLSLECALATLAIHAMHLHDASNDDSYQRIMSSLWSMRHEAKNVIRALQAEYPDMHWKEEYEQRQKAARSQAPSAGRIAAANRQADREASNIVWSDGYGALEKVAKP